jgi:hypothetical protein
MSDFSAAKYYTPARGPLKPGFGFEWGSPAAGRGLPAALMFSCRLFRLDLRRKVRTLNFGKSAKFRMRTRRPLFVFLFVVFILVLVVPQWKHRVLLNLHVAERVTRRVSVALVCEEPA